MRGKPDRWQNGKPTARQIAITQEAANHEADIGLHRSIEHYGLIADLQRCSETRPRSLSHSMTVVRTLLPLQIAIQTSGSWKVPEQRAGYEDSIRNARTYPNALGKASILPQKRIHVTQHGFATSLFPVFVVSAEGLAVDFARASSDARCICCRLDDFQCDRVA